jgi:hypothetical protein
VDATGVPILSWVSPLASVAEFDCGNGTKAINSLVIGPLGEVPHSSFAGSGGDGDSVLDGASGILSIRGDVGAASLTTDAIKSLSILGSVRGDATGGSAVAGHITLNTNGTGIVIVTGSIIGGDALNEGFIDANNRLTQLTVRGSIFGGTAPFTGMVDIAGTGTIGAVSVLGSIFGGTVSDTGVLQIASTNTISTINVGGHLIGGSADRSGVVSSGPVTTFTLGGSLFGGTVQNTGDIKLQRAGTVNIKGSIFGGHETNATANSFIGTLSVTENLRTLTVGGDVVAGTFGGGTQVGYNGAILVGKNITTATIRGSLIGNTDNVAMLLAGGAFVPPSVADYNAIGRLTILGSVSQAYIASGQTADLSSFANRIGNAENPDAGIGPVIVNGDWTHSSLNGGLNDIGPFGIDTGDTHGLGDPLRTAKLASVFIRGHVFDNPTLGSVSGFASTKIITMTVGGVPIFKTGDPNRNLDSFGLVDVFET